MRELNITVLEIFRGEERLSVPDPETVLAAGDVPRVRADVHEIGVLQGRVGVRLKPGMKWREADLESAAAALVEAVVARPPISCAPQSGSFCMTTFTNGASPASRL